MGDLLKSGLAWLENQRKAHLASPVMYRRGAAEVEVLATVGRSTFEVADAHAFATKVQSRDYLIAADDLVLDGTPITPRRGDVIEEPSGDATLVCEVLPFGGEPEWRFTDGHRTTLRIHTKHVRTE